jgi:hypothetical protein
MKKITVLMAAVLAVATVLAAGLAALPGSVQEAQANPCSIDGITYAPSADIDCDGVIINEEVIVEEPLGLTQEAAEEAEDAEDAEFE